MTQRFKVTLAYDGTNFAGFQAQPNQRTVQFVLEKDMNGYKQGDLFKEDFYNGQAIKSSPLACGGYWDEFSVVLTAIDRRPQLT